MALVYLVTNRVNGKQYVGFTGGSLAVRRRDHMKQKSPCRAFSGALKKYGPDMFIWEVIARGERQAMLSAEARYIAQFDTMAQGYNLRSGGEAPSQTLETRQKIGDTRRRKGCARKGVRKGPPSDAHRAAMSAALKHSHRTRQKSAESLEVARRALTLRAAGMSILAVARAVGLSEGKVASIEKGRHGWCDLLRKGA